MGKLNWCDSINVMPDSMSKIGPVGCDWLMKN
jgi:hypothetical protein